MSTGNIFREYAKEAGMNIYEFENTIAKKDVNFDIKLDQKVKLYWQKNDNFVFESRLAWYFIPDSFKIFLDCEQQERYRRIQEREQWELEDIIFFNTRREKELAERYGKIYPEIQFPPKAEDFDLFIDATSISPEEIIKHILSHIWKWSSI